MKKEMVCIVCPMSCHLQVTLNELQMVVQVDGNTCPRGEVYARKECTAPERVLTSTVRIQGAIHPLLPVISERAISKDKIQAAMKELNEIQVQAPVHMYDVIMEDVADTKIRILASRTMEKQQKE